MTQVPVSPLVTPTGRLCSSGKSSCSMLAKKAFMSTRAMALGQRERAGLAGMDRAYGAVREDTGYLYSILERSSQGPGSRAPQGAAGWAGGTLPPCADAMP